MGVKCLSHSKQRTEGAIEKSAAVDIRA